MIYKNTRITMWMDDSSTHWTVSIHVRYMMSIVLTECCVATWYQDVVSRVHRFTTAVNACIVEYGVGNTV